MFQCFPFEISTFKACVKQMTKAALAVGLGKFFIFVRYLEWTHYSIHRLIMKCDIMFYPHIFTEFVDGHGTQVCK